jgi:hypothetical protein
MRWLDPDLVDDDWDERLADYDAYLAKIGHRLTPEVLAIASDPRFALHDSTFAEVIVDFRDDSITMLIDAGDLQVGYRRLNLRFEGAEVVGGNVQAFGYAVIAEFPNGTQRKSTLSVTVIRYVEVDLLDEGRFVLRLRLWPFHEVAIAFNRLSIDESPGRHARARTRGGRFKVRQQRSRK